MLQYETNIRKTAEIQLAKWCENGAFKLECVLLMTECPIIISSLNLSICDDKNNVCASSPIDASLGLGWWTTGFLWRFAACRRHRRVHGSGRELRRKFVFTYDSLFRIHRSKAQLLDIFIKTTQILQTRSKLRLSTT